MNQLQRSMSNERRNPTNFAELLSNEVNGLFQKITIAPDNISVRTSERWMEYLGFQPTKATKGRFTDGHERADVVLYRSQFLEEFLLLESRMTAYKGENLEIEEEPEIKKNGKEIVLMTHDESTFYCYEGQKICWLENSKNKILPKSRGQSIMVWGIVCPCHGFMKAAINGIQYTSYLLFEAGNN